jgi:hypothetical protein
LSILFVAAAGCNRRPYLVPALAAPTAAGNPKTAIGEAAGVQIEANGDDWTGRPSNLPHVLTPVLVAVQNQSGKPLGIRYRNFKLEGAGGFNSAALPPFRITGSVPSTPVPVTTATFGYEGFWLAPQYGPYYPGLDMWSGPFDDDFPFYSTYFAEWPVRLPTRDMVKRAIPEGVLANGGHLSGFLYFLRAPREDKSVTLELQLVDAKTGASFGTIRIPFVVK